MNYNTLNLIAYILLGAGGLFLILTILLFIRFNIIAIINDLTGRTARKQIELIRNENIKSGDKKYKPSPLNTKRGKLTEHMGEGIVTKTKSKKYSKTGKVSLTSEINTKNDATELLPEEAASETEVLIEPKKQFRETEVLNDSPNNVNGTEILNETVIGGTSVLIEDAFFGTDVLSSDNKIQNNDNKTTLSTNNTVVLKEDEASFEIVKSIILIHTSEVI